MPSRLPWFRVQAKLVDHPKFIPLSLSQKGELLTVWCCAYGNVPRGKVPDAKVLSRYFGPSHEWNPSRVHAILKRLLDAGWLDSDRNGGYSVHEWEYWQDSNVAQVSNKRPNKMPNKRPNLNVGTNVDYKGDIPLTPDVRGKEGEIIPSFQSGSANRQLDKPEKSAFSSEVKTQLTEIYQNLRSISISACTSRGDWVQVAALCKRAESGGVTPAALSASFTRWLTESTAWEQRQSIAWWCAHWQAFAGVNGNGKGKRSTITPDDCAYPQDNTDRKYDIAYPMADKER